MERLQEALGPVAARWLEIQTLFRGYRSCFPLAAKTCQRGVVMLKFTPDSIIHQEFFYGEEDSNPVRISDFSRLNQLQQIRR